MGRRLSSARSSRSPRSSVPPGRLLARPSHSSRPRLAPYSPLSRTRPGVRRTAEREEAGRLDDAARYRGWTLALVLFHVWTSGRREPHFEPERAPVRKKRIVRLAAQKREVLSADAPQAQR